MVSSLAVTETRFAEQFKKFIEGSDDDLREIREKAFRYFQDNGFPTVRDENWKYSNVAPIAKEDWTVKPVALTSSPAAGEDVRGLVERFSFERNGFTALNTAFAQPVVYRIPKETLLSEPIEFTFSADTGSVIFPHVIVIAESGCKATLVETYNSTSKGFTNTAFQIIVEDNASLTHFRVQKDSPDAFNVGMTEVTLGRGSYYNATSINIGAAIS